MECGHSNEWFRIAKLSKQTSEAFAFSFAELTACQTKLLV